MSALLLGDKTTIELGRRSVECVRVPHTRPRMFRLSEKTNLYIRLD